MGSESRSDVIRRGKRLYEQQIRAKVESAHRGKVIVINVDTGEYEIDDDHLAAARRARAKAPDAPLFALRIGHRALARVGGHSSSKLT